MYNTFEIQIFLLFKLFEHRKIYIVDFPVEIGVGGCIYTYTYKILIFFTFGIIITFGYVYLKLVI